MTEPSAEPWWRRPLTPDEHTRIRRQLFLIPVYLWLAYGWYLTYSHLPLANAAVDPTKGTARDFVHFYTQGLLANEHDAVSLYDMDGLARTVARVLPSGQEMRYPPVYGPQVSVLFSPLARLPYNTALYTWMALTVVTFLVCGWWMLTRCPNLRERRSAVAIMLIAAPAIHTTISFSQASAIGLVCFTAALVAFTSDRPFLAGLAIGALAYKPPLGIAAAVVFVGAGQWTVVAGAMVSAAGQLLAGGIYWGFSIFPRYVDALRRLPLIADAMEPFKYQMHSWRPFFQLLGLHDPAALALYVVAAMLTLGVALWTWWGHRDLRVRLGVLLLATMLVDPHLYVYDMLVLMPGLLLLWDWAEERDDPRQRWTLRGLLAFCYVAPLLGPMAELIRLQSTVLGMSLLSVLATWPHLVNKVAESKLIHRPQV